MEQSQQLNKTTSPEGVHRRRDRNAYMREYRKRHREQIAQTQLRYWRKTVNALAQQPEGGGDDA